MINVTEKEKLFNILDCKIHWQVALEVPEVEESSRSKTILAISAPGIHEFLLQCLTTTAFNNFPVSASLRLFHFSTLNHLQNISNFSTFFSENPLLQKVQCTLLPTENHCYNAYSFNISLFLFLHKVFLMFDSSCLWMPS